MRICLLINPISGDKDSQLNSKTDSIALMNGDTKKHEL
jgi:hypothetical protein